MNSNQNNNNPDTNQVELIQVISNLEYAQRLIRQTRADVINLFTDEERHSNEGVHFGSALYGLMKDIDKAVECLNLINVFRNPEENSQFIEKLNFYAKQEGGENFTGSLCPPEPDDDNEWDDLIGKK